MMLITIILLVVIILASLVYLLFKINLKLLKGILYAILIGILFAIIPLTQGCLYSQTNIRNIYNQSQKQLEQIEDITQKRADLLGEYSLYTDNTSNLQMIEKTRRNYSNAKMKYQAKPLLKKVTLFKTNNEGFNQLEQQLDTKGNAKLYNLITKDKKLQIKYTKIAKSYSLNALRYNYLLNCGFNQYWNKLSGLPTTKLPVLDKQVILQKDDKIFNRPVLLSFLQNF